VRRSDDDDDESALYREAARRHGQRHGQVEQQEKEQEKQGLVIVGTGGTHRGRRLMVAQIAMHDHVDATRTKDQVEGMRCPERPNRLT